MNSRQFSHQNRIANLGVFSTPTPKMVQGDISEDSSPNKRFTAMKNGLEKLSLQPLDTHLSDIEYLDNLLRDLAEISRLMANNPSLFRHAYLALMEEAFAVWGRLRGSSVHGSPEMASKMTKIGNSPISAFASPTSRTCTTQDSPSRPSFRPLSPVLELPKPKVVRTHILPNGIVKHEYRLDKKIYIPQVDGYNFIGRIVGPRGISVRQMESATKCEIVIRGKGSIKDPEKEKRYMNRRGYEHLKEPLHVYIVSECSDLVECQNRLEKAAGMIQSLLSPDYDEYKRTQLLQLAIINGTYRPFNKRSPKKTVFSRSKPRSEE